MIYVFITIAIVFGADILIKALSALKQKFNNKEHYKRK
jgi:hypothetical protein